MSIFFKPASLLLRLTELTFHQGLQTRAPGSASLGNTPAMSRVCDHGTSATSARTLVYDKAANYRAGGEGRKGGGRASTSNGGDHVPD